MLSDPVPAWWLHAPKRITLADVLKGWAYALVTSLLLYGLLRKTEEIRTRNEELERFNRATVGRELNMVRLKQRVNALSAQLGRRPPFPPAFLDETAAPGAHMAGDPS